jgi:hypothetical protein
MISKAHPIELKKEKRKKKTRGVDVYGAKEWERERTHDKEIQNTN